MRLIRGRRKLNERVNCMAAMTIPAMLLYGWTVPILYLLYYFVGEEAAIKFFESIPTVPDIAQALFGTE